MYENPPAKAERKPGNPEIMHKQLKLLTIQLLAMGQSDSLYFTPQKRKVN